MAGEGDGGREAEEEEEEEEVAALSSLFISVYNASKFTRAVIDQPP